MVIAATLMLVVGDARHAGDRHVLVEVGAGHRR